MNKVLMMGNSEIVIYNFRLELVKRLLDEGHIVVISCPNISGKKGERKINEMVEMGCQYEPIEINRHGLNPFEELKLINYYRDLVKKNKPDIIFSYTIKPNIYGALAADKYNVPFVANITGLGTAVENPGLLQNITVGLYKKAFKNIQTVFFQNDENKQFFVENEIAKGKHKMLPGSGVNLEYFHLQEYPSTDETIEFVFISRIMKEKGIDHYLEAAEFITKKYQNTRFHICGFCEEEYEDILEDYQNKGIITYHGMVSDVRDILKTTHCTVHPTYYPEGLSNVLLESAASGRPIISTNRSGTRETIDDGKNGYLVKQKDSEDLIEKIEKILALTYEKKKEMGLNGRKKVEEQFNREIVVNAYFSELDYSS